MVICSVFPVIDMEATGRNIERCRKEAKLTVKDVQNYFGFEYPQAVYKWQHGECLPSVDNLLALSALLKVPMEKLLVYQNREISIPKAGKTENVTQISSKAVSSEAEQPSFYFLPERKFRLCG